MHLSICRPLVVALVLFAVESADAQLRVVDYNSTGVNSTSALQTIFGAIGDETVNGVGKPLDVLVLEEQDSVSGDTQTIVNILNGIYGAGTYARSTVNGATLGGGRPTLVYNTHTIALISQLQVGATSASGPARAPMRFELRPVGYDATADFYVYASHYHSSTSSRRLAEAQQVRANADALGPGASTIHTGDFNIDSSSESMYQELLSPGNGQLFDPINSPGNWHDNPAFKGIHTQNPAGSGFVGGGMDDRFDFQLVSAALLDNEGMSYLPGSYHAFANNNTHTLNGNINTGTGAAPGVLDALGQASDHLPVVAQYQLPAKMTSALAAVPAQVMIGSSLVARVDVANSAGDGILVVSPIGADELDYSIHASGSASGTADGMDQAFGSGNSHGFQLDTRAAGAKFADFEITATSPQVPQPNQSLVANYAVLDHANASFTGNADANTLLIDFGTIGVGSARQQEFDIFNLASTPEFTAPLDLLSVAGTGDIGVLAANLSPFDNLAARHSLNFLADFNASAVGAFAADYTLTVSDDSALLGASLGQPLTLQLRGVVTAAIPGDFDADGDVDGADLLAWQIHFPQASGADLSQGDADGDGDVDGADFVAWQTHFAKSPGQGSSPVWEPQPLVIAAIGGICLSLVLRRKQPVRTCVPHRPTV